MRKVGGRSSDDEPAMEGVFDAIFDEHRDGWIGGGDGMDGTVGVSDEALMRDAAANPYFTDAFRDALAEAGERMREARAVDKAKIDSEVEEIMKRVRAERAMRAGGAGTEDATRAGGAGTENAREGDQEPEVVKERERETPKIVNKEKQAESVPVVTAYDPEFTDLIERHLLELTETSKASIAKLTKARDAIEESLANEKRQLARLEMLTDRVKREIRYRRADEAIRKRRDR